MIDLENADLNTKDRKVWSKKSAYRKIRVVLYLTEQEATDYADEAARVGLRSKSAKLFKVKEHGFAGEIELNTAGIGKFIRKFLFPAWKKSEAERAVAKKDLEKRAQELGLKVE